MDTVPQDAFATLGLAEEGGEGLTGLARALLEAGVNEMMAAQADAAREAAGTTRNGLRERRLETRVGTITLRIPKPRQGTYFPDGLVERWSRVDRAVICAVAEMYALGVSTRRVGKVLERMGAVRLSKVGVRRVVGLACVDAESYASWKGFLRSLRERGLSVVQCVTSYAHGGIARAVREIFPGAAWQSCVVYLERDVIDVPHECQASRCWEGASRRARRGRPDESPGALPGRARCHLAPVAGCREGHGEGCV